MWYVIQVKSGEEQEMKALLDKLREDGTYGECFVPLFEDVKRSGGKCRIGFRKLFPGYIFVECEEPDKLFDTLMGIKDFTKLLGAVEEDGTKTFVPIGKEDEAFMRTLFVDGLMHVSYVHLAKNERSNSVCGLTMIRYFRDWNALKLQQQEQRVYLMCWMVWWSLI